MPYDAEGRWIEENEWQQMMREQAARRVQAFSQYDFTPPSLYPNQAAPYGSFPYADPTPAIWDTSPDRVRQDVEPQYRQPWMFNQEPIADTSAISTIPHSEIDQDMATVLANANMDNLYASTGPVTATRQGADWVDPDSTKFGTDQLSGAPVLSHDYLSREFGLEPVSGYIDGMGFPQHTGLRYPNQPKTDFELSLEPTDYSTSWPDIVPPDTTKPVGIWPWTPEDMFVPSDPNPIEQPIDFYDPGDVSSDGGGGMRFGLTATSRDVYAPDSAGTAASDGTYYGTTALGDTTLNTGPSFDVNTLGFRADPIPTTFSSDFYDPSSPVSPISHDPTPGDGVDVQTQVDTFAGLPDFAAIDARTRFGDLSAEVTPDFPHGGPTTIDDMIARQDVSWAGQPVPGVAVGIPLEDDPFKDWEDAPQSIATQTQVDDFSDMPVPAPVRRTTPAPVVIPAVTETADIAAMVREIGHRIAIRDKVTKDLMETRDRGEPSHAEVQAAINAMMGNEFGGLLALPGAEGGGAAGAMGGYAGDPVGREAAIEARNR